LKVRFQAVINWIYSTNTTKDSLWTWKTRSLPAKAFCIHFFQRTKGPRLLVVNHKMSARWAMLSSLSQAFHHIFS